MKNTAGELQFISLAKSPTNIGSANAQDFKYLRISCTAALVFGSASAIRLQICVPRLCIVIACFLIDLVLNRGPYLDTYLAL